MKYLHKNAVTKTLIGIALCLLAAVLCMVFYLAVQRHTSVIDISKLPVLASDDQTYCRIDSTSEDEHGTIYITAVAQNEQMQYPYHNWVLGDGQGIYQNISLLLVNTKTNQAYQLKTYSHTVSSANEDASQGKGQGVIAYGKQEMLQEKSMVIAALFTDRDGKQSILYPKENKIDESKIS